MSKIVTPVVLSDDTGRHEAMGDGEVFDVNTIPMSTSKLNLLEKDDTGILLTGNDIVSQLEHNPIIVNVDGKLYFRVSAMLSPEDNVLKVSDNLLRAALDMRFDPDTAKLTLYGKNNAVISEVSLPGASGGYPTVIEVLQDIVPPKPEGFTENPYKKGTYLHMRFRKADGDAADIYVDMGKLVDVYTGGNGINVDDHVISVAIKEGDGLKFDTCCDDPACACKAPLTVDAPVLAVKLVKADDSVLAITDGKIASQVRLAYDADQQIISLLGVNDKVLGAVQLPKVELPEIPGMPTNADFVDNPAGYPAGKYLHLTFTLANGTGKDLYVDVSDLVDVYTAGDGIAIVDNKVSAVIDGTMRFNNGKLGVKVPQLVLGTDNVVRVVGDKIQTVIGLTLNEASNTLALTGIDGAVVAEVKLPDAVGIPASADFLINPVGVPTPGTYLRLHFETAHGGEDFFLNVDPLIDVYTAGDGIDITDRKVSVKLGDSDDNAIMLSKSGNLYINKSRLVSKMPENALEVSEVDNKLFVHQGIQATQLGNGLVVQPDGTVKIDPAALIADDSSITLKDGKLFVDTSLNPDDYGTGLKVGGNGKVRVLMSELVAPNSGLMVDPDGKLTISPDALAALIADKIISVTVSRDADNILRYGADGKLYLPGDLGSL